MDLRSHPTCRQDSEATEGLLLGFFKFRQVSLDTTLHRRQSKFLAAIEVMLIWTTRHVSGCMVREWTRTVAAPKPWILFYMLIANCEV